ncbi:MAG: hypothetical protein JST31_13350 [Actinobacteria bacterium]|nr:hypothetical protein [Actinomycetota bacterium]
MPERELEIVAAALRAAGLAPPPEDIGALAGAYPELRALVARLGELEEVDDEPSPESG